jgi:hypothetical protein
MSPRISAPALRSSPVECTIGIRHPRPAQAGSATFRCMAAMPVREPQNARPAPPAGHRRHCIVFGNHITTQGKAISRPSRTMSVATNGITPR